MAVVCRRYNMILMIPTMWSENANMYATIYIYIYIYTYIYIYISGKGGLFVNRLQLHNEQNKI